jgi:hypothetical protein
MKVKVLTGKKKDILRRNVQTFLPKARGVEDKRDSILPPKGVVSSIWHATIQCCTA